MGRHWNASPFSVRQVAGPRLYAGPSLRQSLEDVHQVDLLAAERLRRSTVFVRPYAYRLQACLQPQAVSQLVYQTRPPILQMDRLSCCPRLRPAGPAHRPPRHDRIRRWAAWRVAARARRPDTASRPTGDGCAGPEGDRARKLGP